MRVDSLAHITSEGSWFDTGIDASYKRLLHEMDAAEVEKSMLVGTPGIDDNDFIIEKTRLEPGRLFPVAAWKPVPQEEADFQAFRLAQAGFRGIKIHPRMMGVSLLSDEVLSALAAAARYSLLAFVCTIQRPPSQPLGRPLPDVLHELCACSPQTRIVLLHGGYVDLLATSEVIRPLENVLLDLSFTLVRFRESSLSLDVKYLINNFDRRICVGSDFPEYTYSQVLDVLVELGFSLNDLDRRGILGDNLLKYLGES